jgi:maltooligosyltrehalose synthase
MEGLGEFISDISRSAEFRLAWNASKNEFAKEFTKYMEVLLEGKKENTA